MNAVKIENSTVTSVRSDTGTDIIPAGWKDIEGRADLDTIVIGATHDSVADTFTPPPEEAD